MTTFTYSLIISSCSLTIGCITHHASRSLHKQNSFISEVKSILARDQEFCLEGIGSDLQRVAITSYLQNPKTVEISTLSAFSSSAFFVKVQSVQIDYCEATGLLQIQLYGEEVI